MLAIGTTQMVIIGGVVGAFIVSTIAQNHVHRNSLTLDSTLREKIWKREAQTFTWWRLLESGGIAAMIAGMAKMMGFLPASVNWGIPTMAIGFTVVCFATSLRTWLSNNAYAAEAPQTPASRSAFKAAIWVTLTEVSLGCAVCWFVFTHIPSGSKSKTPSTATAKAEIETAAPTTGSSRDLLWIDEAEALKLLKGKDAAYLKGLVAGDYIRAREEGGKTEFRRDDISATKVAGLPTQEEISEAVARAKAKAEAAKVSEKPKEESKPKVPTEKVQE
jgi:hypothetical protein